MSEKQQAWKRNADAQWQAIYALVPAYRAALAVHNVDFIALNAAVEVHHRALMALNSSFAPRDLKVASNRSRN